MVGALPTDSVEAARGRLLFIPHDNRPISKDETAAVVEKLGYEVIMPPEEYLSRGSGNFGDPDKLWQWTEENISGVDAAMISSDSMIYGGLVPSRKHNMTEAELSARVAKFRELRAKNQHLRLYVFDSLMRTPRSGIYSGTEEPSYYHDYGAAIFQSSALIDKRDMQGLTAQEEQRLTELQASIPADAWQDWTLRRVKNVAVSKQLIDLTREGVFSYFVIGKDDNAPYSQTHHEGRILREYAAGIPETKFQLLAGIDEFGMLLLSRAVNDIEQKIPFVYVDYGGRGAATVPSYSDTPIGATIRSSILVAGGMQVSEPGHADFVLLVNTNANGATGEANAIHKGENKILNDGKPRSTTASFVQKVNDYVVAGYRVGVADIAFANGADNALMNGLYDADLLYKIRAYAGWNTPTNSTGFVVGTGVLTDRLPDSATDDLLTRRYLEDWGYQANVRTQLAKDIALFRRWNVYSQLGEYGTGIIARITTRMRDFAVAKLPPYNELTNLTVRLPWHRMFEADFIY